MKKSSIKTGDRILSFLLVMFILLLFFTPNSYVSAEEIVATQETLHEIRMNATVDLNNQLQSTIAVNHEYPDDYAGAYKDEEGNLIIGVTNEEAIPKYQEILSPQIITEALDESRNLVRSSGYRMGMNAPISSNELVQYEVMPYSYNEIFAVHMLLGHAMWDLGISKTAIIDSENKLYVTLNSGTSAQSVLDYISSNGYSCDFVVFEDTNDQNLLEQEYEENQKSNTHEPSITSSEKVIYSGEHVEVDGGGGTVGFAALYNGKFGYVTAGHVVIGTCYLDNRNYSGVPMISRNSGYGDFAFIPNSEGMKVRSVVDIGSVRINLSGTTTLAQGDSIKTYGSVTRRQQTGKVLSSSINHTGSVTGKVYYDVLEISQIVAHGDSGGPAYINYDLVGIIHSVDDEYNPTSSYICKYNNIQSYGVSFVSSNIL